MDTIRELEERLNVEYEYNQELAVKLEAEIARTERYRESVKGCKEAKEKILN